MNLKKAITVLLIVIVTVITASYFFHIKHDAVDSTNPVEVKSNDSVEINSDAKPEELLILDDEDKSLIKVTFIELGSVNCIPCKMMQPIMEEIEQEYRDQVKVIFHDVWTNEGRPYAEKYRIRVIPTQVFLDKDGKEYFRHEGFFPKEELIEILNKQGVN